MSAKHKQATRAEKIARRRFDDRFAKDRFGRFIVSFGPEVEHAQRGKYMPHYGAKQLARGA